MAEVGRLGFAIDGTTQGAVVTKSILRDVAAVAGVSLRTASRVLNDDPRVAVDTRARVQQAMRDPFTQVIEDETGRKVVAFMSTSHQHPDMLSEMFVLESEDGLANDPGPAEH